LEILDVLAITQQAPHNPPPAHLKGESDNIVDEPSISNGHMLALHEALRTLLLGSKAVSFHENSVGPPGVLRILNGIEMSFHIQLIGFNRNSIFGLSSCAGASSSTASHVSASATSFSSSSSSATPSAGQGINIANRFVVILSEHGSAVILELVSTQLPSETTIVIFSLLGRITQLEELPLSFHLWLTFLEITTPD
jgi:hypothetical protein